MAAPHLRPQRPARAAARTPFLTVCWVSLAEADPYFTVKLHDKTGVEKDEIILKCEVSKDVPVKWFKDGEEIAPSPKHSIKTDGLRRILKIKKAELKDKGEYMCDCGTDTTKANVTVEGESAPRASLPISEMATVPSARCRSRGVVCFQLAS